MMRSFFASVCIFLALPGCVRKRPIDPGFAPVPDRNESREAETAGEVPPDGKQAFALRRAPQGVATGGRYLKAKEQIRHMRQYSIAEGAPILAEVSALPGWTSLGPTNFGGRTRSLVVDPNNASLMYAGAVSGGVWRSTNGGSSWSPTTDGIPMALVTTLAMDPSNTKVLYAGTGESYATFAGPGVGILKSTDGAASWTVLGATTTSDFQFVNKLQVSRANPTHIYAATLTGIWASMDGGDSWNNVLAQSSDVKSCDDVQLGTGAAGADVVFASCVDTQIFPLTSAKLWRNLDAGGSGSWEQVLTSERSRRMAVAVSASNPSVIYAISAETSTVNLTFQAGLNAVYRSTSGGAAGTWTVQTSNQSPVVLNTLLLSRPDETCFGTPAASLFGQGSYDLNIAVDPTNSNRVWVQGIDIFRSDDGGANWGRAAFWTGGPTNFVHADHHALVFAPGFNGTTNQTLYVTTDGGLYMTKNANAATATGGPGSATFCGPWNSAVSGIVWTALNTNYQTIQFYGGDVLPGGGAYYGGTQDNGFLTGNAGYGTTWTSAGSGDGGLVLFDPLSPSTLFRESLFGLSLYRSDDGGVHYTAATNGIKDFGIGSIVGGLNYALPAPFVMDPSDTRRVYIGGYRLWRTADSGRNWSPASPPINGTAYTTISAIGVGPANGNQVYFGASDGTIYHSSQAQSETGTTNWQSTQPRPGFLSAIAVHPTDSNTAYAAYTTFDQGPGDNHVYKTTDGGFTWTGIDGTGDSGLPDLPINAILIDPASPGTIYLGGDTGIFVSFDGGGTWMHDASLAVDTVVVRLLLDRGAGVAKLFAFTHGRGAFSVAIPNSGIPCTYSLSPRSQVAGPGGEPMAISVNTQPGCVWAATIDAFDPGLLPPASGVGPGTLYYRFDPSTFGFSIGVVNITVQGQQAQVSQSMGTPVTTNDEPASAAAVGTVPYGATANTSSWTANFSDPVHSCTRSRDTATGWFRFVAPATNTYAMSLTSQVPGSFADAGVVLAVYAESNGAIGQELGCAASTRGTYPLTTLTVPVKATAGQSYLIEAAALASSAGGYVAISVVAAPPQSLTISPSNPTGTGGTTMQFTASGTNLTSNGVRWAVTPPNYGTMSASGLLRMGTSNDAAVKATVTATSIASPAVTATTTVTINPAKPVIAPSGVTNSASHQAGGGVAPGEIVTILGTNIGPSAVASGTLAPDGSLATSAGGTQVLFDGRAAPVVQASVGKVVAIAPYEIAGQDTTQVQIVSKGQATPMAAVPVRAASPGLYTNSLVGSGPAFIQNQDGAINSTQFAAVPGTVISLYATGDGQSNPAGVTGQVNLTSPGTVPLQSVSLIIGGESAQILYAGGAPSDASGVSPVLPPDLPLNIMPDGSAAFVSGLMQIVAVVPGDLAAGNNVPVALQIGDSAVSQANVTMAVAGDTGQSGLVYYMNTGQDAVQISLYSSQASASPAVTTTIPGGLPFGSPVDLKPHSNLSGIQAGSGPVRVLGQVCQYFASSSLWLCKGNSQNPFGN